MNDDVIDSGFNTELHISTDIKSFLNDIATWANIIAIAGFIMMLFMVIMGFVMGSMMGALSSGFESTPDDMSGLAGGALGFIYLIFASIYFFPLWWLFNFARKMKIALRNNDQEQLSISFRNLKNHYLFIGVLVIIAGLLYALGLVFMLVGYAAM